MRVISKARLKPFWELPGHEDAEGPLRAWSTHINSKTVRGARGACRFAIGSPIIARRPADGLPLRVSCLCPLPHGERESRRKIRFAISVADADNAPDIVRNGILQGVKNIFGSIAATGSRAYPAIT